MGVNGVGFCGVRLVAPKCHGEVRVGAPRSGAGRQQDAVSEQGGSPVNSQFIQNKEPAQPCWEAFPQLSFPLPHKTPCLPAA